MNNNQRTSATRKGAAPSRPRSAPRKPAATTVPERDDGPATPASRLALRRLPAQARGLASFDKLLTTAAKLLEEVGIQGLTTNLIAARSGVNISSIYKYFPNKQAILVALFERQNEQRFAAAREDAADMGMRGDWRRQVDQSLDFVMASRRSTPGNVALRRAMRSSPELAEIDRGANEEVARWLGARLQRLTGLSQRRALLIARVVIETEVSLLDWWESPEIEHQAEVAREIKALVKAYLALYVKDGAGRIKL